ncbi:hypothetical protein [Candidatus Midichloria mitochondrii]|nr:hypothetical protein [Candidatus Midichloria mitochondrii]
MKKYIDENPEAIMKSIENHYAAKANEAKAIQKICSCGPRIKFTII